MSESLGALQDQSFARARTVTVSAYPPERRLTAQQLEDYLSRRVFAAIGTTRPDGRPHTAMSSYAGRGTTFWLPTVGGSVRERNVRHQPWLTMTVTEGDREAHVVVLIEGPAEVIAAAEVPADVRAAVRGDWAEIWIRLQARRLLSYASEGALS